MIVVNVYSPRSFVMARPAPVKFGSSGAEVLVALVNVAAGELACQISMSWLACGRSPRIEQPTGHGDSFPERFSGVLQGEVGFDGGHVARWP